ncbi:metal-dependent hydrolase [Agreia pratensis]|uniref:metal-dependent hydrolase n=1 Tax=Agreia pratensis TaxID=150121 RepID=UPI00188A4AFE|nr:metal-dependent hydrolase [Agreia pratensis]MBF4635947.1 metal-dependent hydrolase [Agreia pratensis]
MTLPTADTIVTYPAGDLASTGTVLHSEALDAGRRAVLLDVSACHPVDSAWPDQPADRAVLTVNGVELDILDCVVGSTDGESLHLGGDVPVRKGTEGWAFVTAHIVDDALATAAGLLEGSEASIAVDADYRHALSVGHTACHLASLALNAELAGSWSKDASLDALEHPNFDALAIETSRIHERGSVDVYRVGKSLRKKGFAPARLVDDLGEVARGVDARLSAWAASGAAASIQRDGDRLTDRRYWTTTLDGHPVSIPCGGTHVANLRELTDTQVTLHAQQGDAALELRMTTRA